MDKMARGKRKQGKTVPRVLVQATMFMVGNAQTTSGFTRNKMFTFYKYRVGVVCEAFNEVIK